MNRDKDEQKIEELFQGYSVKNPPEELMKNYVHEVRLKIRNTPGAPAFGFPAFAVILAVSALLGGAFWLRSATRPVVQPAAVKQMMTEESPALEEAVSAVTEESFEEELQAMDEEADFEGLADDLMVLELLGEDSGLMDDSDRVEADLSFFAGA